MDQIESQNNQFSEISIEGNILFANFKQNQLKQEKIKIENINQETNQELQLDEQIVKHIISTNPYYQKIEIISYKDNFCQLLVTNTNLRKKVLLKIILLKQDLQDQAQILKIELCKILFFEGDMERIKNSIDIYSIQQFQKENGSGSTYDLVLIEYDIFSISLQNFIDQKIKEKSALENSQFSEIAKLLIKAVVELHDNNIFLINLNPLQVIYSKKFFLIIDFLEQSQKINANQLQIDENLENLNTKIQITKQSLFMQDFISPEIKKQLQLETQIFQQKNSEQINENQIIINQDKLQIQQEEQKEIIQDQLQSEQLQGQEDSDQQKKKQQSDTQTEQQQQQNQVVVSDYKNELVFDKKTYEVLIDPFKNDIYNLGLIIFKLDLLRRKFSKEQLDNYFLNQSDIFQEACLNNLNNLILNIENFFLAIKDDMPVSYQIINILQDMLQIESSKRMSTLKLALLTQQNILIKFLPDPSFDYTTIQKDKLFYTFLPFYYKGALQAKHQRAGEGEIRQLESEKLIYSGSWHDDVPDGKGKYNLFSDYYYEGSFKSGMFYQKGNITFKDQVLISGEWQGFMMFKENWLECKDKINRVQIEEKYIIEKLNQNQKPLYNYEYSENYNNHIKNQEETMLSGTEFQITAAQQNVFVDEKSFDIFIQIVKPITQINFAYFDQNSLTKLSHILPFSPNFSNIQVIKIRIKSPIESEIVVTFLNSTNCNNLQQLDLSNSDNLGIYDNIIAETLVKQEKNLKSLIKLSISKCKDNTSAFVQTICKGNFVYEQLLELDLSDSYIENRAFEILLSKKPFKKLKRLNLKNCQKINSEGMQFLNNNLGYLNQTLQFDLTGLLINATNNNIFKDQNIDAFKKFASNLYQVQFLNILVLDNSNINDSVIEILAKQFLKFLSKISLRACSKISQKSVLYIQQSYVLQSLRELSLDFSSVTLPKPGQQENWKNIKISLVHCKQIELSNLNDYFKQSRLVEAINFNAKFMDQNMTQIINNNYSIKQIGVKIDTYLEVSQLVNFLSKINKNLVLTIENVLQEDINFIYEELQSRFNKKEISPQYQQFIFIKGLSFKQFQDSLQNDAVTKIKNNQFLNQISQISAKNITRENNFVKQFYFLINHSRSTNLKYLDLSQFKNVDNQIVSIIASSTNLKHLEKLDLSSSTINQFALVQLSQSQHLENLKNLILQDVKDNTVDGLLSIIQSPNLKSLQNIRLGFANIERIIKEAIKFHSIIYIQFDSLNKKKIQEKNLITIEIDYKYIKNAKFYILLEKGKDAPKPKEGECGIIKIKLSNFCKFQIVNESEAQNITETIIEMLKFKLSNKEIDDQQQNQQKELINNLKIVVLGQQLSGKKFLILKWCYDIQEQDIYNYPVGSLYFKKDIVIKNKEGEQERVRCNMWYFSEQNIFNDMQKIFYQDADVILLVFDLNSSNLEQEMKNYLEQFKTMKHEKKLYIVGNKLDLQMHDSENRKIAKKLSSELEIDYVETSAAQGTNVNALFHQLSEEGYFTKFAKQKFTADQLIQLGHILSQLKLKKIIIKFDFIKSRQKISLNQMCEFCHKFQQNQSLQHTELNIKNWIKLTKYEQEILFLLEKQNFRINLQKDV